MRKHAFAALIMLFMSILAGCGGGGSGSTLVVSTDSSFTAASDVSGTSGRTFYSAPLGNVDPVTYTFNNDATQTATWGTVSGKWEFNSTEKTVTLTPDDTATNPVIILKRHQIETDYWLVYDTNNSNKLFRLYTDSVAAKTYLDAINKTTTAPTTYLLAGAIQGAELSFSGDVDTITVTTFAGSPTDTAVGKIDGNSTTARFNHPTGITSDKDGNLYVTDTDNHTIRKITSGGIVSTIAGVAGTAGSADNTTGISATFNLPQGLTCDGNNLYVTDSGNATIRKIDLKISTYPVTTLAGAAGTFGAVDSTSTGADARFYTPVGITTDGTNLYVTDFAYHTIRKISIATVSGTNYSKSVTTLAGYPNVAGATDAIGTSARLYTPTRITTDGTNLYVTEFSNHTIRKIVIATGNTTTIAGSSDRKITKDGTGTSTASFYYPSGITTDGTNLYITESNGIFSQTDKFNNVIRKLVISTQNVSTIAGGESDTLDSKDTASGVAARFSKPLDIVSSGSYLFITNYADGNNEVRPTPKINNIRKIWP